MCHLHYVNCVGFCTCGLHLIEMCSVILVWVLIAKVDKEIRAKGTNEKREKSCRDVGCIK